MPKGLNQVMRRLDRELKALGHRTAEGVHDAAELAVEEAKRYTPVDTGRLISSYEIADGRLADGPVSVVANTAPHAVIVHEASPRRRFKRPGAGRKFLERALVENTRTMLDRIAEKARIR